MKVKEFDIRVDWADLDLFGHVNNVAFFKYMQSARVSFCEHIGLTSLNEENKLGFIVAESKCSFKKPLLYPGSIKVLTHCAWVKNSSLQLVYQLFNNKNELIADGEDVLVVFDYSKREKANIPQEIRERI